MAACAYCNTTILFGGRRDGALRYCNAECQEKGALANVAAQLPEAEVQRYVAHVHRGDCPQCSGPGPVDVHTSYRVWSAILMTSWKSRPVLSCRSCGVKRKLGDTVFSVFLGWWGFPWGLLITPMQVLRNVGGLLRTGDPTTPSPTMEKMLRLAMATEMVQSQQPKQG